MGRLSMNACLMAGGSSWFVRKRCAFTFASPPFCMPSLTYKGNPFALCAAILASPHPAPGLLGHIALRLAGRFSAHFPVSGQAIIPKLHPVNVILLLWLLTLSSRMRSDMSTFFEDIKVARPTSMMIIPRIANMLYDQAQEQIRKAKGANKQVRAP